eukprot:2894469-Amphidinium_carterae.1
MVASTTRAHQTAGGAYCPSEPVMAKPEGLPEERPEGAQQGRCIAPARVPDRDTPVGISGGDPAAIGLAQLQSVRVQQSKDSGSELKLTKRTTKETITVRNQVMLDNQLELFIKQNWSEMAAQVTCTLVPSLK